MAFNLAQRIKQVRTLDEHVTALTKTFEEQIKPFKALIAQGRGEILEHLNETGQKSANTEFGGTHWKDKVTYRVEDKGAFMSHVIGSEQWELVAWSAAGVACETFTEENDEAPPGLSRNSVRILYVTAPTKVNKRPDAKPAEKGNGLDSEELQPEA